MSSRLAPSLCALAFGLALVPQVALAQELPYGDVSDEGGDTAAPAKAAARHGRVTVTPYIEAQQVVLAELSPGSDVLTWSTLAAGIDASLTGRNSQGSLSLRYERRFGWGDKTSDNDVLSGVARASAAVVPQFLTIEAGAMAARMSVENSGSTLAGIDLGDSTSRIYSLYAGPSIATQAGDVALNAHYRVGYSRVEAPDAVVLAPGQGRLDLFDDSLAQMAEVHAGIRPGTLLPVGLGLGAGWLREDVSNLDQRVDDKHVRADATLPLTGELALIGGVGYEDVTVSSRDAVRDPVTGLAVIGADGRYVTDHNAPRQIAFESDGLIWDAGVLWRPSRRTALEAHIGRRYGSTTYYGSFAYAPSDRTSVNISAYDNYTGFGGMLTNALAALPTGFEALRNPLSGDLGTCVAGQGGSSGAQGGCLTGALGSVRSAVFRSRGVMATLGVTGSRLQYGLGAGYDRRKFVAAAGTVLAGANGVIDENVWLAGWLNGRIDRNSRFATNVWANWHQSGEALAGDVVAVGATAAYYRSITSHLTATAALGTETIDRDDALDDLWTAQAMLGLRYSF